MVGRLMNSFYLGIYQVAYKISTLPLTEVTAVFSSVTFPIYVQISEDKKRLRRAFLKTLLAVSLVVIPFGLLIYLFSREIILIVLGEKWIEANAVLKILANGVAGSLMFSLKMQKQVSRITLIKFLVLGITIVPFIKIFGLVGAGYSVLLSSIIVSPVVFYYVKKCFD